LPGGQRDERTDIDTLPRLLLVSLLVSTLASGCEPGGYLIVENQRNYSVTIYVTVVRTDVPLPEPKKPIDYGIVQAHSTKQLAAIMFPGRTWVHRIQAIDSSGKVVFSQDYNRDDMYQVKWKIIIPP